MKDGMFQKTSQLFVTLYGNAVVNMLDKALEVAEQNVDYYLPPIEDEENVERKDNDVAIERIGQLYSKIRERFYLNVTAKLQNAQMQSWETVSKLNFTITLMQYARENVDSVNQILHQTKDSLQKNASWLWEELNKLDPSVKPSTVVERVLYLARQLTRQLVTSYNSLAPISQLLPVTLQQNLDSAQKYSLYVYNQLHEAKDLNEMSSVMVTELKQNLLYLETCILNMLDYTFLHKLSSPEVDEEETEVVPTS
ncbi:uncharacterized protein LOC106473312 [Limulus polyphemus]|uniref:Uncharacterized protein LOC106473312 n=1 Tax=Limulus polyphemus TaxID=6850 RepID=A0ABM1BVG0_LIMPO|nr:uncharacterized protein LOC106473312 [Limulus polyphemus]